MGDLVPIAQFITTVVLGFVVWSVRTAFKGGELSGRSAKRLDDIESRMLRAGTQVSDLASSVQGLPDRFRREFVSREMADRMLEESREDRRRLWDAMNNQQKQILGLMEMVYKRRRDDT